MTSEEMEELKGIAASMGLYDDKKPCKRAVILRKAIKALEQESCEDAISREHTLAEFKRWYFDDKTIIRCAELVLKNEPPANPQSKTGHWIPVSERLPEEYGEYMITWISDQTNKPLISIAEYEHDIDQWMLDDYINNAYTGVGVTAWMPLPPAYKGDKE